MRKLLRLLLFLVVGNGVHAQVDSLDDIYLFGTVKDYATGQGLEGAAIEMRQDGIHMGTAVTDEEGKYELYLAFDHDYRFAYGMPDHVAKTITIDARHVPKEQRVGGFAMNVDMVLFQPVEGIDYSILDQPIGKAAYDPKDSTIAWDLAYTERIQWRLELLLPDDPERVLAKADSLFAAKAYLEALMQYRRVKVLEGSDDPYVENRIAECAEYIAFGGQAPKRGVVDNPKRILRIAALVVVIVLLFQAWRKRRSAPGG